MRPSVRRHYAALLPPPDCKYRQGAEERGRRRRRPLCWRQPSRWECKDQGTVCLAVAGEGGGWLGEGSARNAAAAPHAEVYIHTCGEYDYDAVMPSCFAEPPKKWLLCSALVGCTYGTFPDRVYVPTETWCRSLAFAYYVREICINRLRLTRNRCFPTLARQSVLSKCSFRPTSLPSSLAGKESSQVALVPSVLLGLRPPRRPSEAAGRKEGAD